jgi:hypothetical protein
MHGILGKRGRLSAIQLELTAGGGILVAVMVAAVGCSRRGAAESISRATKDPLVRMRIC